jgi:hypothetical protein
MWKQIGQRVEERDLPTTEQARFGGVEWLKRAQDRTSKVAYVKQHFPSRFLRNPCVA